MNSRLAPSLAVLLLLLAAAVGLVACGGSSGGDASTTAAASGTESVIGGGSATCDYPTFKAWAEAYGKEHDETVTLDDGQFACKDGWAVLFPNVGDGDTAYTETLVVQAEGPAWALMDKAEVCGSSQADAMVPADLYAKACQTN
jgi:ABC-type phosphate transport system substrate-binding protein